MANLLAGEVPRLILKEYDLARLRNQSLQDKLTSILSENQFLKSENFQLKEEIRKEASKNEMMAESLADLNEKYQIDRKRLFMAERMNDELISKELAETKTLMNENYDLKI